MDHEELSDIQAAKEIVPAVEGSLSDEAAKPVEATEAEPKKLSLREQINKSVETVRKAETERDPVTGKFTKESHAKPKEAAQEIPEPKKDVQPAASKPSGPPPGWSKEAQALWDTLPPAVKADAVRREAEVTKGFNDYREKTAQLQEIQQALAPVRHVFQQAGLQNEAQAVKRLIEWEAALRTNARLAIPMLARQYGVDLSTLTQGSSEAPSSAAQEIPSHLRPVIDQFGNIVQEVSNLKGELQRSREEKVSQELSVFAKDKPHFEKVRVRMGQLIMSGAVAPDDLESAYQQAIWADPEIRATLLHEQETKAKADWQKNQTTRAMNARQAAISPGTRAPAAPVVNGAAKPKGIRGSILASIEQLREDQRA